MRSWGLTTKRAGVAESTTPRRVERESLKSLVICVPLVINMDMSSTLVEITGDPRIMAPIIATSCEGSTEITKTH